MADQSPHGYEPVQVKLARADREAAERAERDTEFETRRAAANGAEAGEIKASNPKDIIGSRKLDMGSVPWSAIVGLAIALWEGVVKYGRFNWRICGVSASTYHAAAQRHMAKWWNGQRCDKKTRVHHLDSAMACLAIIRDAELYGKLTDDRPPCPDPDAMALLIDEAEESVRHLRETFADHKPYQYTIADTERRRVAYSAIADQRPEWVENLPACGP